MHKKGRPVLVGTTSVERSEDLADMLRQAGAGHSEVFQSCCVHLRLAQLCLIRSWAVLADFAESCCCLLQ